MQVFERARDIILSPKETWLIIKNEATDINQLFFNYAAVLALVPAVVKLINLTILGVPMPTGNLARAPFFLSLMNAVVGYALSLLSLLIGAWVVKFLAPKFNSKEDFLLSVKLVIYSMTPMWLASLFALVPGLAIFMVLGLYSVYLLALGLPALLDTPTEKVILYAIAIIALGLLITAIFSLVVTGIFFRPMYLKMMVI